MICKTAFLDWKYYKKHCIFLKQLFKYLHLLHVQFVNTATFNFKGALSGLIKFLATESRLKLLKNALYFQLSSLFESAFHTQNI